jgi:predicted LPLAT superfamily acyltransferase
VEIKQRGNAFGYLILLWIYRIFGYRLVSFILNFVALYYVLFTPSVKKSMKSYYLHLDIKLTNLAYFMHIRTFALSIFDRFVSRIKPSDLTFNILAPKYKEMFSDGGIVLLSHVGSWAAAAHCLKDDGISIHAVMRENTQENIHKVEQNNKRDNENDVKIIDLAQGMIAANIQIANALLNNEVIAMMVDRVVDNTKVIEVDFFGSPVKFNRNPFEIALRLKKSLIIIFVMNTGIKQYDLLIEEIDVGSIEDMAQSYSDRLSSILKKYPSQWYNFFDFFK